MGPNDSFKGYQAPHVLLGRTSFNPPRDLAIPEIGKGSSERARACPRLHSSEGARGALTFSPAIGN